MMETPPPEVLALFDQSLAAVKQAHGSGHSQAWYEALAWRMIWYKTLGTCEGCPVDMPEE